MITGKQEIHLWSSCLVHLYTEVGITSKKPWCSLPLILLEFFLFFKTHLSTGTDTITPGQSLSGKQTITSPDGVFELGFFTPGNSQNYYIGIWYKGLPDQTVVWVANRNQSVSDPFSSALKLSQDGNLVLLNWAKTELWSTNSTSDILNSTIAMLVDGGNFVILHMSDSSNVIWQSFDHPTDTWLPGGKLGYNKLTNEKQMLASWKNSLNPAPGLFSLEVEPNGTSHLLLWNGSKLFWNSGYWTGKSFSLAPEVQRGSYITNFTFISNENESYFTYAARFPSVLTRVVLDVTGQIKHFVWRQNAQHWTLIWSRREEECDVFAFCGAFSSCNQQINAPLCECMKGFEPRMQTDWELGDHSEGCVRRTPLQCDNGGNDSFFLMPNTRRPADTESFTIDSIEECELACLRNCSCTGYAYDNGCFIWKKDLFNLQQLPSDEMSGKNFHVRIAASELVGTRAKAKGKTGWIVIGSIGGFLALSSIFLVTTCRRRQFSGSFDTVEDSLQLFKYRGLLRATKKFSEKLGEGGFGSVFRGTLPNSTGIAVKKLKDLKQGEKQFRAEVSTLGMIQHINLVRLRGFCAEASKRFLVYDYMPKGSLESHLFRKESKILDWRTRYHIAIGIAKGLAYLHEKCRDCIIHCDIKPENILLDDEYNPKVADFGLAKLFGREFSRALTTIRGTIGYMAPEWISGEAITPKADIFSYGMLLFEVISGRRNRDLVDEELGNYFPFQVFNTISKGEEVLPLLDNRLEGNANMEELTCACKIACWCIQDDEKDRPTMGQVVQILEGVLEVGLPSIPRFYQRLAENPVEYKICRETSSSSNYEHAQIENHSSTLSTF